MTGRTSSYLIGNCTFRVTFANLVDIRADALVSSDDSYLTMGGGVSAALLGAGGPQLEADAHKHVPLALGDVAVTTAGDLPAKYVFHGITIEMGSMTRADADCLRRIVDRCLTLAEALRLRHVAFPALAIGTAGFPAELAADAMTRAIADFLSGQPEYLAEVTLALHAPFGARLGALDLFYERSAAIAAQWTDSRRLRQLVKEVEVLLGRADSADLQARARQLLRDVTEAETSLADGPDTARSVASLRTEHLGQASNDARDLANRSIAVVDWEDVKARETVLQLRLQSLRTQHNILIGNRNQLEERKAKFGPHAVPLEVENALTDIVREISGKEDEIRAIKSELSNLYRAPGGGRFPAPGGG